jgi:hypothetical protein
MSAERKAARRPFLHPGPSAAAAPPSSAASDRHTEHKEERQHGDEDDEAFSSSSPPLPSPAVRPRDGALPARRATALLPVAVPVDPSTVPTALPVLAAHAVHSSDGDDAIEAASPSPPIAAVTGSSRRPHIAQQGRRGRWIIAGTAAILVLVALVVGLSVGLTTTTTTTQGTAAAPSSSVPAAAPTASPSPIGTGNCTEERSVWYRCGGTSSKPTAAATVQRRTIARSASRPTLPPRSASTTTATCGPPPARTLTTNRARPSCGGAPGGASGARKNTLRTSSARASAPSPASRVRRNDCRKLRKGRSLGVAKQKTKGDPLPVNHVRG